jgi:hypothetical protein
VPLQVHEQWERQLLVDGFYGTYRESSWLHRAGVSTTTSIPLMRNSIIPDIGYRGSVKEQRKGPGGHLGVSRNGVFRFGNTAELNLLGFSQAS